MGEFSDLSFLKKENFDEFIREIKDLELSPEELSALKNQREKEINASLVKLNNDIYQNEKSLSESDRVYLVAASIMATLGVPGKLNHWKMEISVPVPRKETLMATSCCAKSMPS